MNERICQCGHPMKRKRVDVIRVVSNREVVIKNVPALRCDHCQETLYHAKTVRKMDELIHEHPRESSLEYPDQIHFDNGLATLFDELGRGDFLESRDEPVKRYEVLSIATELRSKLLSA